MKRLFLVFCAIISVFVFEYDGFAEDLVEIDCGLCGVEDSFSGALAEGVFMSCKNCGEKCKDVCSFDDNVGCKGEKSNFKDKQGIDGGYINCKAIKKFDCDLCLENYDKKGEAFSYYEKKTTRDPDWIGAGQCKGTYTTVFLSGSRMNRGVISMDCKIDTCKEGYSKNGNKCEVKGHITDESVEEVNVNGYTGFFGSAVDNTGNRVSVESGSAQTCSKNYHWIGGKCEFNYRIVNN